MARQLDHGSDRSLGPEAQHRPDCLVERSRRDEIAGAREGSGLGVECGYGDGSGARFIARRLPNVRANTPDLGLSRIAGRACFLDRP